MGGRWGDKRLCTRRAAMGKATRVPYRTCIRRAGRAGVPGAERIGMSRVQTQTNCVLTGFSSELVSTTPWPLSTPLKTRSSSPSPRPSVLSPRVSPLHPSSILPPEHPPPATLTAMVLVMQVRAVMLRPAGLAESREPLLVLSLRRI